MRKIRTTIYYDVEYLPTSRHRKSRIMREEKEIELEVEEVTEEQFPVAAIVQSKQYVFTGREKHGDAVCELLTNTVRFYNGKLWIAWRKNDGAAVSKDSFYLPDEIPTRLVRSRCSHYPSMGFDFDPILYTTEEDALKSIERQLKDYLIFDGVVWTPVRGEPVYEIFYGSGFCSDVFIRIIYLSPSDRVERYNTFSAMQREECIKVAKEKAGLGASKEQLDYLDSFEDNIIVKMPSIFSFRRVRIDKGNELNLSYCLTLLRMKWEERHREVFHNNTFNVSVVMDERKLQVDAQRNDGQVFKTTCDTIDDVLISLFNGFGAIDRYSNICDVVKELE